MTIKEILNRIDASSELLDLLEGSLNDVRESVNELLGTAEPKVKKEVTRARVTHRIGGSRLAPEEKMAVKARLAYLLDKAGNDKTKLAKQLKVKYSVVSNWVVRNQSPLSYYAQRVNDLYEKKAAENIPF